MANNQNKVMIQVTHYYTAKLKKLAKIFGIFGIFCLTFVEKVVYYTYKENNHDGRNN